MKTIKEWQKEVHALAVEKGWWEQELDNADILITKLALIGCEVSEAIEEVRRGRWGHCIAKNDFKPEGLPSELADIAIRLFDLAETLGLNLERDIEEKHDYNKLRGVRHGGKLA